jgi:endonuclease III
MTSEEIFNEVLKSPELQEIFQIPKEDLEQENFFTKSEYRIIEIIKTIISGQENYKSKEQIFQNIQKLIMQL